MSARGANTAGALSAGLGRYGEILMQLMARKDDQKRYESEALLRSAERTETAAFRKSQLDAEANRFADTSRRADESAQMEALTKGFRPAKGVGELLAGVSMAGPLPAPVFQPEITAPKMSIGGKEMAYVPPVRKPLADLNRGGVSVKDVPVDQVSDVLAGLPQDAPETMTPYQQAQIALQRDQLALARDKSTTQDVPKATDPQMQAGSFARRMETAEEALSGLRGGAPSVGSELAGSIPLVGGLARRKAESTDQQQYRTLAQDWVRAKLRKESGAAIGEKEMEDEMAIYFEQPGDDPKTVELKQQRRAIATEEMKRQAGAGASTLSGSGRSGGAGPEKPFNTRAAELKATGKSKEEVRRIMEGEGYYR